MKNFTHCPFCHHPLLNEYLTIRRLKNNLNKEMQIELKKECKKCQKLFRTFSQDDNDNIYQLDISFEKEIIWYFNFETNKVFATTKSGDKINFDWFEPDFSNIPQLRLKLKTYLMFS